MMRFDRFKIERGERFDMDQYRQDYYSQMEKDVSALVAEGKLVNAIQVTRLYTRARLRICKAYVDAIRARAEKPPHLFPQFFNV